MKKLKIYLILTVGSLFLQSRALALSDIEVSGEADLAATFTELPTSNQGESAITIPSLRVNVEAPLRENNSLFIQLETAEQQPWTNNANKFDTHLKEGYLTMNSVLGSRSELRYGVIPDFWNELEEERWEYDFWGLQSYTPLIRFGYSAWSVLGVQYQSELPDDWGQWSLSAANDYLMPSDQGGSRKQVQLILNITKAAPFYAMFSYSQGSYEDYDPSFNVRSRAQAFIGYEFEKASIAAEYYKTKDPANAISLLGIANGVDVTALTGTSVQGQGTSVYATWRFGEKSEMFGRFDWLKPVQGTGQSLQSATVGLSYESSDDIKWALAYEGTQYSLEYGPGDRETSQIILATRVNF